MTGGVGASGAAQKADATVGNASARPRTRIRVRTCFGSVSISSLPSLSSIRPLGAVASPESRFFEVSSCILAQQGPGRQTNPLIPFILISDQALSNLKRRVTAGATSGITSEIEIDSIEKVNSKVNGSMMRNYEELHIYRNDACEKLLPILKEKVFHVTEFSNINSIIQSSAIMTNENGSMKGVFGHYSESYFRKKSCVSVFDYREIDVKKLNDSIGKCAPWQSLRNKYDSIAIFFLSKVAIRRLCTWKNLNKDTIRSDMIVPHVESGHPGSIPISDIDDVLVVRLCGIGEIDPIN